MDWASTTGAMHACGHDVHMAALVAVVRALRRVDPPAPVLAVLQPREETYPSGAREIVASGVLQRHELAAMVTAHVQPLLAPGEVAATPGAVNAAADEFTVTMAGSPGHAAYPHLARDPVLALAQFIVAVQQLVSRDADPMTPAVVTVGALAAGTAANAIPGQAVARGTVRAMSQPQRERLHERLREVAHGVAMAHGCRADTEIAHGEPVLVNDPALAAATARVLASMGVPAAPPLRSCGADDFAYYSELAPSLMLLAGTGGQPGSGLHTATYLPAETAVDLVADAMLAAYLAAAGLPAAGIPSRAG